MKFLNWLVTSDIGKKYIVKEFKFIPAFTDIPFEAADLGDIATAVQDYSSAGKTLSWHWAKLPDGSTQQFEASIQAYIAGTISKEEMLKQFDKSVENLLK